MLYIRESCFKNKFHLPEVDIVDCTDMALNNSFQTPVQTFDYRTLDIIKSNFNMFNNYLDDVKIQGEEKIEKFLECIYNFIYSGQYKDFNTIKEELKEIVYEMKYKNPLDYFFFTYDKEKSVFKLKILEKLEFDKILEDLSLNNINWVGLLPLTEENQELTYEQILKVVSASDSFWKMNRDKLVKLRILSYATKLHNDCNLDTFPKPPEYKHLLEKDFIVNCLFNKEKNETACIYLNSLHRPNIFKTNRDDVITIMKENLVEGYSDGSEMWIEEENDFFSNIYQEIQSNHNFYDLKETVPRVLFKTIGRLVMNRTYIDLLGNKI